MCGIAGEVAFQGNKLPNEGAIKEAQSLLSCRGPDEDGLWQKENVRFAHTRLKIFDLSDASAQPMHDPVLGLHITFNGAIYNYKELREELKSQGYQFFSTGDTEVILKSYHAWGEKALQRFQGMFSFVIYNEKTKKIFAARDRLGIKPFYYHLTKDRFLFASTMPALLKRGDIKLSFNQRGLHSYMSLHAITPLDQTIFNEIKKLEPGYHLTLDEKGNCDIKEYWHVRDIEVNKDLSWDEAKEGLKEKLLLAAKRRMVADVEVGVLLSGGLDSSLIVGLLHHLGHKKIQTFSVGFESTKEEKGDEFQYSDIIAKRFETTHHKITVPKSRTLEMLPSAFAAMSEPMVSHDNIGFYLLSKEVKKHVSVVQSGQGADEVFAGYHWYPELLKKDGGFEQYRQLFFDRTHEEMETVFNFSTGKDWTGEYVKEMFDSMPGLSSIDKALRIDTTFMLAEDPVKRVDSMTSSWGLEARVPFLDHELVEYSLSLPAEMKVKGDGKHILKELSRELIPSEVIDRPKGYFPVPALKYLRGDYLEFVKSYLQNEEAKDRGLISQEYVSKIMEKPDQHITPLRGSKLWQIASLEAWLQTHGVDCDVE